MLLLDMGRGRISIEGVVARGILAAAVGSSLIACSRRGAEPTVTPEPTAVPVRADCSAGAIYPENKHVLLSGEYLIKPVTTEEDQCFFVLADHPRLKARLWVYKEAMVLLALVPEYGFTVSPMESVPPRSDYTIDYEFRGLSLRVSLTVDGSYLIEYSFDESHLPPAPTPAPTPWPGYWGPNENSGS